VRSRRFPAHRDERGELVVVEGADLDFPVRRVFTVTGADGGGPRGGHRAECTELVVLVAGSATLALGTPRGTEHHELTTPGESVTITAGDHVDYQLDGSRSVVLVLCDEPFGARP
jgi:hypothetical protein